MTAKLWTVANAIMLVMFVFSTIVQFNDPDAPVWIAVYAAAAALAGLEIRRSAPLWAASALALIAFIWAGYIGRFVHNVSLSALFAEWEMKDLRVEEAREMYGLIIVGAWMTAVAYVNWMRRNRAPRPS
jgi:transmembrane protein TMEM220